MSNDTEWGYGTSALDVLDKFHESSFVVFVEGDEDVLFWSAHFNKAHIHDYYIEPAGGILELRKIMTQILTENARVIVACDADYAVLLSTLPIHPQIISTYGYSIENTIYCPRIINSVIDKLSHRVKDRVQSISQVVDSFCEVAKILVVYDIAREKYGKPIEVCGNNCSRFLKSRHSPILDDAIISSYISSIRHQFSDDEIEQCERLLESYHKGIKYIIRGHFLTNCVINIIKTFAKSASRKAPFIPLSTLYALTSDGCKMCDNDCPECEIVMQKINDAYNVIKLL